MRRIIFGVLALLLTSCMTIAYEAPPNKNLKLGAPGDPTSVKIKRKVWYALWGLVPLTSNSTVDMLESCREVVRVKTYFGVDDYCITSLVGGCTMMTKTVEIECK